MILKTTVVITNVLEKTGAKGFEKVKVGDRITLEWDLNGKYHGAPRVSCYVNGEFVDKKIASTLHDIFFVATRYRNGEHTSIINFEYEEVK